MHIWASHSAVHPDPDPVEAPPPTAPVQGENAPPVVPLMTHGHGDQLAFRIWQAYFAAFGMALGLADDFASVTAFRLLRAAAALPTTLPKTIKGTLGAQRGTGGLSVSILLGDAGGGPARRTMDGFDPGRGGGCGCGEMGGWGCGCGEIGDAACDSCMMWREHCYWNHMSDDKKQFLVVASDDFRQSMRIPQEVGSHLRNLIPENEPVKLEAPSGRVYPVEVSKEFGDVVLRSGWNEFVNAHHIQEYDSILFMYRGNSSFKVHMFNSSGHEKYLSCSQPPSGISGAVPPLAPCNHHVLNEQVVPNTGRVTSADFDYTMLPGCRLTKVQDEKVLKKARTMRSEIPLYVAAMNKSNVSLKNSYVYIPLRLVENFKDKAIFQLEAPDNNTYSVGASKHSADLIIMESGWNAFVASLRIQENDLLIFRSKGKTRLQALILDPSGHEKTYSCSFTRNRSSCTQEMRDDYPPPHQVIDLTDSDDNDIPREGRRESCRTQKRVTSSFAKTQKMASTSSASPKSGYGAHKLHDRAHAKRRVVSEPPSNNLAGASQRRYILAKGKTLPLQVEKKVEEKVQSIQSELPIFVRVMTTTNVEDNGRNPCMVSFCMKYASACLPDETQPVFLQLEGKTKLWHATLSVTSVKQRWVYLGWKEFVKGNLMKEGDICLFQLASNSNTGSLTMTVHLIHESEAHM